MYNYLTVGYDCSPAAALRSLNLREFALPFDWCQSSIYSLEQCFQTNFSKFHEKLRFNPTKTRLIDEYGFEFPHDYPLNDTTTSIDSIGEGVIGEENGKVICDNWLEYHSTVKEKYDRRIKRFLQIINDPKPIIVLCRYSTPEVKHIQQLFSKYYKKNNIFFINSSRESFSNDRIFNIYTEKNGTWNDPTIWKAQLDKIRI